jgi:hypothetical protein
MPKFYCPREWSLLQRIAHYSAPAGARGCRQWLGSKRGKKPGYAAIQWEGKLQSVTRLLLEAHLGRPLKNDMLACHTCDDCGCVEVQHIYEGTYTDNNRDRSRRGRNNHTTQLGEANNGAILTATQIRQIRADLRSHRHIAQQHGVSRSAISRVKTGSRWSHVP